MRFCVMEKKHYYLKSKRRIFNRLLPQFTQCSIVTEKLHLSKELTTSSNIIQLTSSFFNLFFSFLPNICVELSFQYK